MIPRREWLRYALAGAAVGLLVTLLIISGLAGKWLVTWDRLTAPNLHAPRWQPIDSATAVVDTAWETLPHMDFATPRDSLP